MKTGLRLIRCTMVVLALLAFSGPACPDDPIEGEGSIGLSDETGVLLPPGHPGYVDGSQLVLPAESVTPLIHYANCFAGVPNLGDIGIGSSAGFTQTFVGTAVLPVNLNLGTNVLGSYTVDVTVSDPSLLIISTSVDGSYSWLSTDNCADRCSSTCTSHPTHYPKQFDRARGFEVDPTVTAVTGGIRIEAADADPANPSTGVLNLANVPIRIVSDLPATGAVVTFNVISLKDDSGLDLVPNSPYNGIVIKNFVIR